MSRGEFNGRMKSLGGLTWTETGGGLRGGVDGDGEGAAGANHLLCGGDAEGFYEYFYGNVA